MTATDTKPQRKIKHKKCSVCGHVVKWEWGSKPEKCPHCEAIQWSKPHDEAVLFNLQEEYLATRNPEVLGKMFPRMKEYARRIIKKNLAGNARYDEFTLEAKASDSANKLVEYFLEKPTFKISESWGFYLTKIVQQYMYAKKYQNIDQNEISLETPISRADGESDTELKDQLYQLYGDQGAITEDSVFAATHTESMLEEVMGLVGFLFDKIAAGDPKNAYLMLVLFQHQLDRRSRRLFTKFYRHYGQHVKTDFERFQLIISSEIEEMAEASGMARA